MSKSGKTKESSIIPDETPITDIDPNLLRDAVIARETAHGIREAEIEAGINIVPTEDGSIDTWTQVAELGDFWIYEVPFLDPEDNDILTHMILFVPVEWNEAIGGWSINVPTSHDTIPMAGDFWWLVARGRAYSSKEKRIVPVMQMVLSPKLATVGANVKKQLQMLSRSRIKQALETTATFKEAEALEYAETAVTEKNTWKSIAKQRIGSHRQTGGEIAGLTLKAHGEGAKSLSEALVEKVTQKQTVYLVLFILIIAVLASIYMSGGFG